MADDAAEAVVLPHERRAASLVKSTVTIGMKVRSDIIALMPGATGAPAALGTVEVTVE